MNKKFVKILVVLTLFSLLMTSLPVSISGTATTHNGTTQSNKVNTSTPNQFSVPSSEDLIYNVSSLTYNGGNTFQINDYYGNPNGNLTLGDHVAFNFQASGNNGTMDYVNGTLRDSGFYHEEMLQYFFLEPANITTARMGPPMLYFVIPTNLNYSEIPGNFTSAGYTVINTTTTFGASINYYSGSSVFSKVGGASVIYDSFVNVTWDKATGIMQTYTYSYTGSPAASLALNFLGSVDINTLNPYFAYNQAGLFYNVAQMVYNGTNQENLNNQNNQNNPQAYGYISQGQNAFASVEAKMSTNGPILDGQLNTQTGGMSIDNPYNNTGNGPTLFFLFPISSSTNWWNSVSLELSVQGFHLVSQNAGIITFIQFDPTDHNNNVTSSFNMTTGVQTHFLMQLSNATGMVGQNYHGPFIVELNLLKAYNLGSVNPAFAVNTGLNYQYNVDTLNWIGSTSTNLDNGTLQQGQTLNVKFQSFHTSQGLYALANLSTATGYGILNMSYDIFGSNNNGGPLVLLFALPVANNPSFVFNFFGDMFHYIAGATITNNATVFGFSVKGLNGPDVNINELTVQWNKTNGLMLYYKLDISNPNNATEHIQLTLSYIGSTVAPTSSSSNPSSKNTVTSSPGFEFPIFMLAIIPVLMFARKRKQA